MGAMWVPVGTTIVGWAWLGVPDKYDPPLAFGTHDEATAYANRTGGRVEVEYSLRAPDGRTWSLPLRPVPERFAREAAVGAVVTEHRYLVGPVYERDRPGFPSAEEAEAVAEHEGTGPIQEQLTFRTSGGDPFEAYGSLGH